MKKKKIDSKTKNSFISIKLKWRAELRRMRRMRRMMK
jgi:hypothetical protein